MYASYNTLQKYRYFASQLCHLSDSGPKSISMYEKTIFGNLKFEFEFDISTKSMPPMYMKHSSSK